MRLSRPNGAANHGMPAVTVVIPSMRMQQRIEIGEPAIERLGEVVVGGLTPRGVRRANIVRLDEAVRAALERRRRARPIDLVAPDDHLELEGPGSKRLEVHAKASQGRARVASGARS